MDKGLVGGSSMLLVLSLLTEKDMYGYEIIRALDERSDSTFQYREGTLYPVLHKLENKGFVTSYKEKTQQGKERKYYSISAMQSTRLYMVRAVRYGQRGIYHQSFKGSQVQA